MKKICFFLMLLFGILILSSCSKNMKDSDSKDGKSETQEGIKEIEEQKTEDTFTDDLGYMVTATSIERVAVCSGSLAHIWQLAGGSIVAATQDVFSYEPVSLSEDTIDIGDLKRVNVEQILASNIDFIIMSAIIGGHAQVKDALDKAGIKVAYFNVETFEDYLETLHIMTSLTGREDLYQTNGLIVKDEVNQQMKRKDESHPRILLLRALTTEIKVQDSDNMTGMMLKDLGCENIADSKDGLLESLSLEAILKENPEAIFITMMGDEEQARQLIQETIFEDSAWAQLTAVKEKRCYILPKELFHNKPNNRWGESYQMLADLLYEEIE